MFDAPSAICATGQLGNWTSTPLVVDGVMYLTQRPNDVVAVDARTGRVFWTDQWATNPNQKACCGANSRGVPILGDRLYMGTLDARLIALDTVSGKPVWNVKVADINKPNGYLGGIGSTSTIPNSFQVQFGARVSF